MNKLVCPISEEKIQEHLPRVTAFYVVSLIALFSITQWFVILIALSVDFALRAINKAKYSPIHNLALLSSKILRLKTPLINKAPKLFAARLGTLMFIVASILSTLGFGSAATAVAIMVALLASLECIANFCVGCIIYTAVVLPFSSHKLKLN